MMYLSHPNIAELIDFFDEEEYFVMVTEMFGTPWGFNNPNLSIESHPGLLSEPYEESTSTVTCDLYQCMKMRKYLPCFYISELILDRRSDADADCPIYLPPSRRSHETHTRPWSLPP